MQRRAAFAALGTALFSGEFCDAVVFRRSQSRANLDVYTFEQYARDFRRDYRPGSQEFSDRRALFAVSLAEIKAINTRNSREGRLWKAGAHPFMDWSEAERQALNGYKPAGRRARRAGLSFLHSAAQGMSRMNASAYELAVGSVGGLDINTGPEIRDQGNCGSCWAISAVEALEAQLMRNGGSTPRISAQALVDCVPNPQHCGGGGGCDGATGELAYAWVRDHGIPLEEDLAYTASTGQCSSPAGLWRTQQRIRASGWAQLPSNRAQPLMQALVERGPVVVAVDGNSWFNYESGIFDDCSKNAILGHAVLAKGYSKDTAGNKYWLIQNSWGRDWGESGHIRLLRHEDEDQWCGVDNKPQEGVGCDGGPPEITVCGACGLLYDPIVPTGVRIEGGGGGSGPTPGPVFLGGGQEFGDAVRKMEQVVAA